MTGAMSLETAYGDGVRGLNARALPAKSGKPWIDHWLEMCRDLSDADCDSIR